MTWLGVGNVEGVLLRAALRIARESVLLRGGVAGYQAAAFARVRAARGARRYTDPGYRWHSQWI